MVNALNNSHKNRKAQAVQYESFESIIMWILFLIVAGAIIYFAVKKLTG